MHHGDTQAILLYSYVESLTGKMAGRTGRTLADELVGKTIDLQTVRVDVVLRLNRVASLERTEGAFAQTAFALAFVRLAIGVLDVESAVGALEHRRRDQLAHSFTRVELGASGALGTLDVAAVCLH